MREGNAGSIMCSYNAVNGVPSCANSFLQNTIVREQWGFEGYIVGDETSMLDVEYQPCRSAIVEPSVTLKGLISV